MIFNPTPMNPLQQVIKQRSEKSLDLLHEVIQHTPLKIEETNGDEYDKGYIHYQDMVVETVKELEPKFLSHNKETVVAILEAVKLLVAIRASRWQDYYGHHITAVALGDVVNELSSTLQDIKKQNNE